MHGFKAFFQNAALAGVRLSSCDAAHYGDIRPDIPTADVRLDLGLCHGADFCRLVSFSRDVFRSRTNRREGEGRMGRYRARHVGKRRGFFS